MRERSLTPREASRCPPVRSADSLGEVFAPTGGRAGSLHEVTEAKERVDDSLTEVSDLLTGED